MKRDNYRVIREEAKQPEELSVLIALLGVDPDLNFSYCRHGSRALMWLWMARHRKDLSPSEGLRLTTDGITDNVWFDKAWVEAYEEAQCNTGSITHRKFFVQQFKTNALKPKMRTLSKATLRTYTNMMSLAYNQADRVFKSDKILKTMDPKALRAAKFLYTLRREGVIRDRKDVVKPPTPIKSKSVASTVTLVDKEDRSQDSEHDPISEEDVKKYLGPRENVLVREEDRYEALLKSLKAFNIACRLGTVDFPADYDPDDEEERAEHERMCYEEMLKVHNTLEVETEPSSSSKSIWKSSLVDEFDIAEED